MYQLQLHFHHSFHFTSPGDGQHGANVLLVSIALHRNNVQLPRHCMMTTSRWNGREMGLLHRLSCKRLQDWHCSFYTELSIVNFNYFCTLLSLSNDIRLEVNSIWFGVVDKNKQLRLQRYTLLHVTHLITYLSWFLSSDVDAAPLKTTAFQNFDILQFLTVDYDATVCWTNEQTDL